MGAAAGRRLASALDAVRPAGALVIGFSGGARASLGVGDLVLVDRACDAQGESACPPALVADAARRLPGLRVGPAMTVGEIAGPEGKARHGLDALVVDLESAHLARELASRGIPFLIVRAVLDPVWDEVPSGLRLAPWAGRAVLCARRLGSAARRLTRQLAPGSDNGTGIGRAP